MRLQSSVAQRQGRDRIMRRESPVYTEKVDNWVNDLEMVVIHCQRDKDLSGKENTERDPSEKKTTNSNIMSKKFGVKVQLGQVEKTDGDVG